MGGLSAGPLSVRCSAALLFLSWVAVLGKAPPEPRPATIRSWPGRRGQAHRGRLAVMADREVPVRSLDHVDPRAPEAGPLRARQKLQCAPVVLDAVVAGDRPGVEEGKQSNEEVVA